MDTFWINLSPGAFAGDPRASWIQKDELRHAISMAVNRELFVNTVYFGAGVPVFGPIAPANKKWYSPEVPHAPYDPARAKQLLASIGLVDRNGDGILEDAHNHPARFTVVTQKGRTDRERAVAVISDELKKIGLIVDVVPLAFGEMMKMLGTGKYESLYFGPGATDIDPAVNQDFWLSNGDSHFWNPGQAKPATDWERRIDELMARQVASLDDNERKRLFTEVQKSSPSTSRRSTSRRRACFSPPRRASPATRRRSSRRSCSGRPTPSRWRARQARCSPTCCGASSSPCCWCSPCRRPR